MRRMEENISDKVAEIVNEAKSLAETLGRFPFVEKVYPTDANFLLVKVDNADALYDYLLSNGVIVRNRSRVAGCEECLRFTIGTPDENARVINLLNQYPL